MTSSEKESFSFQAPVAIEGAVETWMSKVEAEMRATLYHISKEGVFFYAKTSRCACALCVPQGRGCGRGCTRPVLVCACVCVICKSPPPFACPLACTHLKGFPAHASCQCLPLPPYACLCLPAC